MTSMIIVTVMTFHNNIIEQLTVTEGDIVQDRAKSTMYRDEQKINHYNSNRYTCNFNDEET